MRFARSSGRLSVSFKLHPSLRKLWRRPLETEKSCLTYRGVENGKIRRAVDQENYWIFSVRHMAPKLNEGLRSENLAKKAGENFKKLGKQLLNFAEADRGALAARCFD